ncbi:hypothetical protein [Jeotgalicoccus sp. FSL K6-3177]|uniref:hypothetical protein n=1 Tax=Jeotgalicoccus sp. FSL K6-3177 TaxID=2921494 RepID=UPI0030FDCF1F
MVKSLESLIDSVEDIELQEVKRDFEESQRAVIKAMKKIDRIYNEGGLSVDDYHSIQEELQHAEI